MEAKPSVIITSVNSMRVYNMQEKKNRLRLLVATYCYEMLDSPIISDAKWDELAKLVDVNQQTDRPDLDQWFKDNFSPHTGQWIYKLPPDDLNKIQALAKRLTDPKQD